MNCKFASCDKIYSLQVIHSARANATHNHGLDPDRLLVGKWCKWSFSLPFILAFWFCILSFHTAEAFLGKGYYRKRVSYHAKGKCGIRERAECRLTVVVREMTAEEEAEIARLRVSNFRKLTKRERRLVPHKLIETTSIWNRKGKGKANSHELSGMDAWTSFTSMCHNLTESSVEMLRDLFLFLSAFQLKLFCRSVGATFLQSQIIITLKQFYFYCLLFQE